MAKRLPLEGIRVIDMTVVWAGPFSTVLLSDMGAEVIRVERAQSVRGAAPETPHFDTMLRGRRNVALDLKHPDGLFYVQNRYAKILGYNTVRVKKEDAPKSWKDLLNPRWAGLVSVKLSTSGLQHSTWYTLRELYGAEYGTKFAELKPRGQNWLAGAEVRVMHDRVVGHLRAAGGHGILRVSV